MKKVLVFLILLLCLIASEYFFLTELLSARRLEILVPSFVATILTIFGLVRSFRSFLASKQPEVHS